MKNWTFVDRFGNWTFQKSANDPPFLGKTMENKNIRFHVFRGSVRVWDLENAGKRGKRVDYFALHGFDYKARVGLHESIAAWVQTLPKATFASALAGAKKLEHVYQLGLESYQEKGVDVAPAGFKPFQLLTNYVSINADDKSFSVRDLIDQNNLPTCIPGARGQKTQVKLFYRWVQDNESRLRRMTYLEILREMSKIGIQYHEYCAMD